MQKYKKTISILSFFLCAFFATAALGAPFIVIPTSPPGIKANAGFDNINANFGNATNSSGISGGQTIICGSDSGDDCTITSTSDATKGFVSLGFFTVDENLELIYVNNNSPQIIFTNLTQEDTAGGRESILSFAGRQLSGITGTLAQIVASHDGTGADRKGSLEIKVNDGNDATLSPVVKFTRDGSGAKVAINTISTPQSPLNVGGLVASPGNAFIANFGNDLSGGSAITLTSDGEITQLLNSPDGAFGIYNGSAHGTIGSPRIQYDATGDVAIGDIGGALSFVDFPSSQLTVGDLQYDNAGTYLDIANYSYADVTSDAALRFKFWPATTSLNQTEAGKITAIKEASYAETIGSHYSSLGFSTVANAVETEKMRIRYDGNVGIGITAPSAALDLTGSTSARASLRIRPGQQVSALNEGEFWFNQSDNGHLLFKKNSTDVVDLSNQPSHIVYVNSRADLPPAAGGKFTLAPFTNYIGNNFATDITLTNDMEFSNNSKIENISFLTSKQIINVIGTAPDIVGCKITYSGVDYLFQFDIGGASSVIRTLIYLGSGKGFNVTQNFDPNAIFVINNVVILGGADLGIISDLTFLIRDTTALSFASGIEIQTSAADIQTFRTSGLNLGATHITFSGASSQAIQVNGYSPTTQGTEYAFYFDPATVYNGVSISDSVMAGVKNRVFQPTSFDQTSTGFKATGNVGIPDSTAKAYLQAIDQNGISTSMVTNAPIRLLAFYRDSAERFTISSNGNFRYDGLEENISIDLVANITGIPNAVNDNTYNFFFAKGNTDNTITSFANAGAGQITVTTSAAHGYSAEIEYISQTGNYTVGLVATGSISGATGIITKDEDFGTTGFLAILMTSGTFTAADTITDTSTGSADADVVNNPRVIIEDSPYDGGYTITEITPTTFEITDAFIASSVGKHYEVLNFTKSTNQFKAELGNTSLVAQIEVTTNDILFIAIERIAGANAFNTNNIQLSVKKI